MDNPLRTSFTSGCVVACGQRYIRVERSGLSFPAWLVVVEELASRTTEDDLGQPKLRCCWWRSKLDFLKLARALQQSDYDRRGPVPITYFPKASFQKLALQAPWIRPDASHQQLQVDTLLSDNDKKNTINRWKPLMTKSLSQLDKFLESIAGLVGVETTPQVDTPLAVAWKHFCRPHHTDSLIATSSYDTQHLVKSSENVGNDLGQYFCSPENAQQLVDCLLQRLLALERRARGKNDDTRRALRVIEPSCGHGQIIWTLCHAINSNTNQPLTTTFSSVSILGMDIDQSVLDFCYGQKPLVDSSEMSDPRIPIFWRHADFLQSTPSTMSEPSNDPSMVVMIGGPPYSAGAGHGASGMHLELPAQFVEHAIHVWKAVLVVFIMPQRCRLIKYHLPPDYLVETVDLIAPSTFYFQGRGKVHQPSIIQCFMKEEGPLADIQKAAYTRDGPQSNPLQEW